MIHHTPTTAGLPSTVAAEIAFDAMPAAGPDAELLAAVDNWRRCVDRRAAADTRYFDLLSRLDDATPPTPAALRVQIDDPETLRRFPSLREIPAGEPLPDHVIVRMCDRPMTKVVQEPCPPEWGENAEAYVERSVPDPVAQARADQVAAAVQEREVAEAELWACLGLDAAEAEYKASGVAAQQAIARVSSIPATSIVGLTSKAAAFAHYTCRLHIDEAGIADEPSDGELTILLSIARDAAALAPVSTRGNS